MRYRLGFLRQAPVRDVAHDGAVLMALVQALGRILCMVEPFGRRRCKFPSFSKGIANGEGVLMVRV